LKREANDGATPHLYHTNYRSSSSIINGTTE